MSIDLFEHNKTAYEAAVSMLSETGKAAIVHPTGTGKSFIGFKLCEDNPSSMVCWLSPSEYIFKTQLENLTATGAEAPVNFIFLTYTKLMLMSSDEIAQIQPAYIILDEFHRCGAEQWGRGVQTLLSMYANVPVLGLSATNIRYLDNQRDMADELFDGNVASTMTLGEAIVRGILNPPKYVLSVFSYQKDLEKYEKRIRLQKSKATRDTAQEYLGRLCRALDKADGMDEVFHKHMTDRDGKYIVFCSDAEHMQEMLEEVPKWFGKVDKQPNVYTAYSADPNTDKAFEAFKKDDSKHLKLLFCIDMLNEGVHVEDISGVILLRPTISPIIYKQQIGRALSAGKKKNAVIFDVVLNIENLYSIDTVKEEMQVATTYYRSLGMNEWIVNEEFTVIDEVRDCLELFDKLNDSLSASWHLMYLEAKKFVVENGNLEVPRRYVTAGGYSLGAWLNTQRSVRAGKYNGTLTDDQIALLDNLGMRWESASDQSWGRYYEAAKSYYEEHGDLKISRLYKTAEGLRLGAWIANLRSYRKSGIRSSFLSEERVKALEQIGMQWDVLDYLFERNCAAAIEYHREHGDLNVPTNYLSRDGFRLGVWISNLRMAYKRHTLSLTKDQIYRLDALGMLWEGKYQGTWEQAYAAAQAYQAKFGTLIVPTAYRTEDGILLGRWVQRQRESWKQGRLSDERKRRLDEVGMFWGKQLGSPKMAKAETCIRRKPSHKQEHELSLTNGVSGNIKYTLFSQ